MHLRVTANFKLNVKELKDRNTINLSRLEGQMNMALDDVKELTHCKDILEAEIQKVQKQKQELTDHFAECELELQEATKKKDEAIEQKKKRLDEYEELEKHLDVVRDLHHQRMGTILVSKTHVWSVLLTAFGGRGEEGETGRRARAGGCGLPSFQL